MAPSKKRILRCCVPNCDSTEALFGDDDDNGIKLYKFPSDKPLMRKWVAQIGRGPNFIPTERSRVCSKHFQTGRKSYKASHVDYIPNIFWYNTVKNSEFCSGCRRKVCKCDAKEQESKEVEAQQQNYDEFSEKEMFRLLQTIEAEAEQLEVEELNNVEPMDQTVEEPDVTEINSFLTEDCTTAEPITDCSINSPPNDNALKPLSCETETTLKSFHAVELERTNFDETIDCCVRGEDSVGDEILLRQIRKIYVPPEPEVLNEELGLQHQSNALESDIEFANAYMPETNSELESVIEPVIDSELFHSIEIEIEHNLPETSEQSISIEALPIDQPEIHDNTETNSELEIEWKRRERLLMKKHKAEEKRMVLEIIRNNQVKNQAIEKLKQEMKELKQSQKNTQTVKLQLEKKMQTEYEDLRKNDIKNILDEANSNLSLLQTRWSEEKRVLIEANSALARLCNGELEHLNDLQAEFMCSVISACSAPVAGIPQPPETHAPPSNSFKSFHFESCADSDEFMKYFTGMPTVQDFNDFYALLEPNAKTMSYWNGKSWTVNPPRARKPKSSKINLKNRLFLTLARFRRGFATKELGFFYSCDATYISCLFITFSKLIENDIVALFLRNYDYIREFSELPEIVQAHYPKLYGTLRLIEIRLDNRHTFIPAAASKPTSSKLCPSYKLLFLSSPSGKIVFISSAYPASTSDRDVILESKVLELIPEGSEIFVEQQFEVHNECAARQVQLLVFPQESTPKTLSENDPWELKLLIKCKSRIEKLIGLMRYFGIFDKGIHLVGNHTRVIRVVLLLQHYIDTYCNKSQLPSNLVQPNPNFLTAIVTQ